MNQRSRSSRRGVRLCLLALAAVLLTGCGTSLQPGTAAVVGSQTIPHDQVERLAEGLCTATTQGQQAQATSTISARTTALGLLVESELSRQFGASEGAEPDSALVAAAVAQNERGLAALPADQREDVGEVLENYAVGQSLLIEIGRESLSEKGQASPADQDSLAEGQRLRAQWVRSVEITLDPRYGSFREGQVRPGGRELSVATSDNAKAATEQQPPPAWVQSLPATQTCG